MSTVDDRQIKDEALIRVLDLHEALTAELTTTRIEEWPTVNEVYERLTDALFGELAKDVTH